MSAAGEYTELREAEQVECSSKYTEPAGVKLCVSSKHMVLSLDVDRALSFTRSECLELKNTFLLSNQVNREAGLLCCCWQSLPLLGSNDHGGYLEKYEFTI